MRKAHLLALAVILVLFLLGVTQGWTAEVAVATDLSPESNPAVAYDPYNNQHMVVWEQQSGVGDTDIYARLVNEFGTVSSVFHIASYSNETSPDVVFNPNEREYVVVWAANASGSHNIHAKRYSANGACITSGSGFIASSTSNSLYRPVIDYNSSSNEYLVVFEKETTPGNHEILAQHLGLDGLKEGAQIVISNSSSGERYPVVSSDGNRYLVAWQEEINHAGTYSYDIRGLMVNGDGSLYGSEFSIASSEYDLIKPRATYNSKEDQFLIVWEDNSMGENPNIFGTILNADDGSIARSTYGIHDDGYDYAPDVSYNEWLDQYLVVFEHRDSLDDSSTTSIWAQPLSSNGSCFNGIDGETIISEATGNQTGPAIAQQSLASFLTVWTDDRNGVDNTNIFGEFDNGTDDYEDQDVTPPPTYFPVNTPTPRSFQDLYDKDWFHYELAGPDTEYAVYLSSTYPDYLKPNDFHVSIWFYSNGTYSPVEMYDKSQTGPDKLWFKTTNGAGIYRVLVTSRAVHISARPVPTA